ncbi:transketolase [Mediterraneibacter sp. NSJ-55]|uniref:Transketolase n=1 Tax=Mediterraneibacter hominis TaxID=2763054 RepID=A0A923LGW7_9FIRM|nr:transketolase C-terminal domain-containing protein [Mediterraneibacter hominis]MBC5688537.1 transketolase [Mediterraneibacter hominis]
MKNFEINRENVKNWNIKERPFFGQLVEYIAEQNENVYFVVADSGQACRCCGFKSAKKRFVECGISEQNMIGVAAGLARNKKKPIAFAFAPFATERCFEQIKVDIAYSGLPVIIVGGDSGVGMGTQGVTHFGWEDIGVMTSLPGITVLSPADNSEMIKCLKAALKANSPVYIRLGGGIPEVIYEEEYDFQIGKAIELNEGKHLYFIATGTMVPAARKAAGILQKKGIEAGVVDMHTIKPLDTEIIRHCAEKTGAIVTLEEHSIQNGMGSMIANYLMDAEIGCRFLKIGLPDEYPHTVSTYKTFLEIYGLTPQAIADRTKDFLSKKI